MQVNEPHQNLSGTSGDGNGLKSVLKARIRNSLRGFVLFAPLRETFLQKMCNVQQPVVKFKWKREPKNVLFSTCKPTDMTENTENRTGQGRLVPYNNSSSVRKMAVDKTGYFILFSLMILSVLQISAQPIPTDNNKKKGTGQTGAR